MRCCKSSLKLIFQRPWCYTTDPMIRYDYCSTIPKCAEPEPPTPEPVMTSGFGSIQSPERVLERSPIAIS